MNELAAFFLTPEFMSGVITGIVLEETGRRGIKRVFKDKVDETTE